MSCCCGGRARTCAPAERGVSRLGPDEGSRLAQGGVGSLRSKLGQCGIHPLAARSSWRGHSGVCQFGEKKEKKKKKKKKKKKNGGRPSARDLSGVAVALASRCPVLD